MRAKIERFISQVRIHSPHAKTWRDYRCDLDHFQAVTGNRRIKELLPRNMDAFVNHQVPSGYNPSTVNRHQAAIAAILQWLSGLAFVANTWARVREK